MIFYSKKPSLKNLKRTTLDLRGFYGGLNGKIDGSLSDGKHAEISYNFDFADGALKSGKGIRELRLKNGEEDRTVYFPNGIKPISLYFFRRYVDMYSDYKDMILAYCDDGIVYRAVIDSPTVNFSPASGLSFSSPPIGINYKKNGKSIILLSTEEDGLFVYDGMMSYKVEGAPNITSMCMHYERLYVTTGGEATELWFSDDFDPTDWNVSLDGAGYIDFQDEKGKLLKVISFLDYVYIFRSYGITRLTAYGDQKDFSVTQLYVSSGQIYPNSITVCGDRIIFAAKDGLFSFDGGDTVRILRSYDHVLEGVDNSSAKGVFYNGKLYMSLKVREEDQIKDVVLVYDVLTRKAYLMKGLKVNDLCVLSGDKHAMLAVVCQDQTRVCEIFDECSFMGEDAVMTWQSSMTDYGVGGEVKFFNKISLQTNTPISVTIITEDGSKTVYFKGSPKVESKNVGLKGNRFRIVIDCIGKTAEVRCLKAVINHY